MKSSNSQTLRLLVMLLTMLTSASANADAAPVWRTGAPLVAYFNGYVFPNGGNYWPVNFEFTTLTEAIAEQAVLGGFNLVWINDVSQLPIAEKYGLRAQLVLRGPLLADQLFVTGWVNGVPDPAKVPAMNAMIDAFKQSPAAYSYYIVDEPGADSFTFWSWIVAYLRQRDPAHLAYIDLYPPDEAVADLKVPDYAAYLSQYISIVQPSMLSYNSYNFFDGNDRSLFLGNMQTIAQAAKQASIPFMPVVQGAAFDTGWRLPNINELRFLSNVSLAFGAEGIWYFHYWTPFGPTTGGLAPFPDGTQTSVFNSLKILNPQFSRVAAKLQPLNWVGTYLKGYVSTAMPRHMTHLPSNPKFDIASVTNTATYVDGAPLRGVLFGYFAISGSAPGDATHVLVQNLDYTSSKSYRVAASAPLSVFDHASGLWSPTGQNYADVTIEAGGSVLVAFTSPATANAPWLPAVLDVALRSGL